MYMAGTLWKWTNYFSGWQERWFVLDNGILSYYKSQDDVNSGCKGSVKMSVCDISVHATDNTRLDLIIPGEQHFYVKASNSHERQEWLVALGSSKASFGKNSEDSETVTNDLLKTKRSELRLYCDLLVQQIHSVKMAATHKDGPEVEKLDAVTSLISPTCDTFIKTLEECMDLVKTSAPFEGNRSPITQTIPTSPLKVPNKRNKNLNRSNSTDKPHVQSHSRTPSVSSTDSAHQSGKHPRRRNSSDASLSDIISKEVAQNSAKAAHSNQNGKPPSQNVSQHPANVGKPHSQNPAHHGHVQFSPMDLKQSHRLQNISETGAMISSANVQNLSNNAETSQTQLKIDQTGKTSQTELKTDQTGSLRNRTVSESDDQSNDEDIFLDPVEPRVPTFFSVMDISFVDLKFTDDGGIPVEPFLDSCKNLLPIFDKLNSTAFAPVKMDFQGNIRKVRTKYALHPAEFTTLQSIILHEISKKQQHLPSSATMALLWMKRGLEFISGFIDEIRRGEQNLSVAAAAAYATSLKPYHGWVVRGVFAVAVKALPYHSTFMTLMNPSDSEVDEQLFKASLLQDMDAFCCASGIVIKILNDFFAANDIKVDEQI